MNEKVISQRKIKSFYQYKQEESYVEILLEI